jgi:ATP-dependent DNA helicase RecG
MTATPIPRTLSLALYGDLDISQLDELPKGRKRIKTKLIAPNKRDSAYQFIKKEINKGRQAFVICPLIEESENLDSTSAEQEYKKLSEKIYPELNVGLLHGQLPSDKKKEMMQKFKAKEIDILVSTSVIEVGIDIPNASVMVIEGAERFGLSQLHQFRGRVGRAKHQSYCLLFTNSKKESTRRRLNALVELNDGFALAEKDLEIRGPGDFIGTRQSGQADLTMKALKDIGLIKKARKQAKKILKESPKLKEYPKLKSKLDQFKTTVHLE